jgi:hypothetical protein
MKSVDVRRAPVEQHPGTTGLAIGLPQHADEHRPERLVLLALDQQLGESPRLVVPLVGADSLGELEVGQHQDVEQLGAGSGTEGV